MKKNITFNDAENKKINLEINLENGRFSMSGDCGKSSGQCYDEIKPTATQKLLIDIWKTYHLNDMKAGTKKQETALKMWKDRPNGFSYDQDCLYLDSTDHNFKPLTVTEHEKIKKDRDKIKKLIDAEKQKLKLLNEHKNFKIDSGGSWFKNKELKISEFFGTYANRNTFFKKRIKESENKIKDLEEKFKEIALKTLLYDIHPETKKLYCYGSGWITQGLPYDLWKTINNICDKIQTEQKNYKEKFKNKSQSWEKLTNEFKVLGEYLGMSPSEAEENIIKEDNNIYITEGIYYYVGDYEELKNIAIDYLTQDPYLYECWVNDQIKNNNAENITNIKEWAEDVLNIDGLGHVLNSWDGEEFYNSELDLYVIRQ